MVFTMVLVNNVKCPVRIKKKHLNLKVRRWPIAYTKPHFHLEQKLDYQEQMKCLLENEDSNYRLHFLKVLPVTEGKM